MIEEKRYYEWKLVIWGPSGTREFVLQHEYATEDEAAREAENVADRFFEEDDEGWSVVPLVLADFDNKT